MRNSRFEELPCARKCHAGKSHLSLKPVNLFDYFTEVYVNMAQQDDSRRQISRLRNLDTVCTGTKSVDTL